ncbi:MAG: bifunctional folylpolyglutamate synthase/dihydrofolate synthase, partial [Anaerolineales bacterium]
MSQTFQFTTRHLGKKPENWGVGGMYIPPTPQFSANFHQYNDRVSWLYTLITDPTGSRYFVEKSRETRLREFKEQLARTADFLAFAGNPQNQFRSIHIAGTSGKSSVVTIMAAILAQAGLRTGFHISPYLQIPNEKLIIDGRMIPPSGFVQLVDHFREKYDSWRTAGRPFDSLRYGEAWVALTYLWFAMQQVDWAVIETGVGGRYDPTNILPSSLAVITNVDFDHVRILGSSLIDIARHKAGIIPQNGIVITSETKPPALQIIEEEAAQRNARLYRIGRDFDFTIHAMNQDGTKLSIQTSCRQYNDIFLPMRGAFQPTNAALSVAALDLLAAEYNLPLTPKAVKTALQNVQFPGRMEIVQRNPTVILDGAHNPHKMRALAESFRAIYPRQRVAVLFGMLVTKDAAARLRALLHIASRFIFAKTDVFGKPPMPPAKLSDTLRSLAPDIPVQTLESPRQGIALALQTLAPDDTLLITGSIYFIGAVRDYWYPQG